MSRQGRRNFEGCQSKTVIPVEYARESKTRIIRKVANIRADGNTHVSDTQTFGAELNCPRIEINEGQEITSNSNEHISQSGARRDLRKVAGDLICDTCVFADMSPLDVAEYQAAIARSQLQTAQDLQIRAGVIAQLQTEYPDQHWS